MAKYLIGIDEVGRGPLAGPVAVGVVMVPSDFDWGLLPGVTDSKKLSERKRERIFEAARRLSGAGQLTCIVSMVSAPVIDRIGIVPAINLAMRRGLLRLESNTSIYRSKKFHTTVNVRLDGGLRAPEHFQFQETIIKGDLKEPVIGLASIMAKVTRDRYMRRVATRPAFTPYDFATHKGYGTKSHREAILKHGLCDLHRQSFCRNCLSYNPYT